MEGFFNGEWWGDQVVNGNITSTGSITCTSITSSGNIILSGSPSISSNGYINFVSDATSGAENIAKFSVNDADGYIMVLNSTSTANTLLPTIRGKQPTATTYALYLSAEANTDTGTTPLMLFDSRSNTGTITTRPLFSWRNYTSVKMLMDANGNLGIDNSTPTEKLDVTGNIKVSGNITGTTYYMTDPAKYITGQSGSVMTINSGGNSMVFKQTSNSFMRGTTGGLGIEIASTPTIDPSALLTLTSTSKGFLPPKMTTTQRDAISSPTEGLMIYNTTTKKHQGYDGTTWNDFY